ncbi:MAG: MFS transporter [Ilumatobacteraceae bacterium]
MSGLGPVDRRALVSVAIQFFVNGMMAGSYVARLPEIRDHVGVTVTQLGIMLTTAGLFGLVGSLLAGRIIERWGTRTVLVCGAGVMVFSVPAIGIAASPVALVLALISYFFLDILVDISMNLQGSWISARRSVPVMNRLHGMWSLGSVVGGLAASRAASASISLSTHLALVGASCAVLLVVVVRGLLSTDETSGAVSGPAAADPAGGAAEPLPRSPRRRWLPLLLIASAGAFAVVLETTGGDWAAFRLVDDLGAGAGAAGLAFVAFTVGMTIGRISGDLVQARLGASPVHRLALALSAAGLVAASLVPDRSVVLAGYLVLGLGAATLLPRLYDDAAKMPGRRGAGLGAMTSGTRVASLIGPTLVGLIAGTRWGIGDAIAVVALPSVVAFAVVTATIGRLSAPVPPLLAIDPDR